MYTLVCLDTCIHSTLRGHSKYTQYTEETWSKQFSSEGSIINNINMSFISHFTIYIFTISFNPQSSKGNNSNPVLYKEKLGICLA